MADSRVPGASRVHEAAAERTVRATCALFDSMTNQARLIDQTYLPRDKAATTGTRGDIVRELFARHQTVREIVINLARRLIERKQPELAPGRRRRTVPESGEAAYRLPLRLSYAIAKWT